jgi:hypothetical protein
MPQRNRLAGARCPRHPIKGKGAEAGSGCCAMAVNTGSYFPLGEAAVVAAAAPSWVKPTAALEGEAATAAATAALEGEAAAVAAVP